MQSFDFVEFLARVAAVPVEDLPLSRTIDRLPLCREGGPWLAGGAIRRTLIGQATDSDFDFFFASASQLAEFETALKAKGAWLVRRNEHNATYRLPSVAPKPVEDGISSPYLPEIEIQCVFTRFYTSLADVLDSFDFTICQFGFDGQNLLCGDYSLFDLGRKRLAIHKITFGVATTRRLLKYSAQGFTACAGCLKDLLEKVSLDPTVINADTLYID